MQVFLSESGTRVGCRRQSDCGSDCGSASAGCERRTLYANAIGSNKVSGEVRFVTTKVVRLTAYDRYALAKGSLQK